LDNFKVSNSPSLIMTFPVEYNISWFTVNPTVKIESVSLDPNNLSVMLTDKTSLTVKSATIIGNQLTISFNQDTIAFTKFHQYFLLKIYWIPPPSENTVETSTWK